MKTKRPFHAHLPRAFFQSIFIAALLACATALPAQDPKPAPPAKPKLSQEALEAKFQATLTKATLSGRWSGLKDGKLTPERDDKYTIVGVSRISGDAWIINAKIEYNGQSFVAPIPVQVKWAGDTPVITLDNIGLPGGDTTYTARVLIYEKTYAGTWSGGGHAGLLSGLITNETP